MDLPGIFFKNNTKLSEQHKKEVAKGLQIEKEWHAHKNVFENVDEIIEAYERGEVAIVEGNNNYLPVMRYRNPQLIDDHPPYINKETKALLDEVTERWRGQASKNGIDNEIRLAVTTLIIPRPYQEKLVESEKLAFKDGPHGRGEAFDIDGCGYYYDETPINPRAETHNKWRNTFKELGAHKESPDFADYSQYEPRVHRILHEVLKVMQQENKLHFIHEYPDTNNTVFHICRHPEYL